VQSSLPEKVALLNLLSVDGVGSGTAIRLVNAFGSAVSVFAAPESKLREIPRISDDIIGRLKSVRPDGAYGQNQLHLAEGQSIEILTYWDGNYPSYLKKLETEAPALLFIRGALEPEARRLAVVGTRSASEYGKRMASDLVRGLRGSGIHIVSGLASGIDGFAHEAALDAGLTTEAVFGCGVDTIYPPSHKDLAQRILNGNGALVSEFPIGSGPDRFHFPQRNRIIAGLSQATLVIEAGEKSGALITALLALEYNRDIFAVPGAVSNPKSRGCHELIKSGASLVEKSEDILDLMKVHSSVHREEGKAQISLDLPEPEMKLFKVLDFSEALHIDSIAEKLGISVAEVLGRLLVLELKGAVRQLPGKYFVRA
jgi:DNA processing protein